MRRLFPLCACLACAARAAFAPVGPVEAATGETRHFVSKNEAAETRGDSGPQATSLVYLPLVFNPGGAGGGGGGIIFSMMWPSREVICDYPADGLTGNGVNTTSLETARSCGTELIVGLNEYARDILQDDGVGIDFGKFEDKLKAFVGIIDPYVADGTIVAHLVIDEPHDCKDWGGVCLTAAEVERAAQISKQYWPTLRTMVNTDPTFAPGHYWQDIDIANYQYAYHKPPLDDFVQEGVAVLDGGYVSDIFWGVQAITGGCDQWAECPMTEAQVREVGEAMCATGKGSYISFSRYDEGLLDAAMVQTVEDLRNYCEGS